MRNHGLNLNIILAPVSYILITPLSDFIGRKNCLLVAFGFYVLMQTIQFLSNNFTVKMVMLGLNYSMDDIVYSLIIMGSIESMNKDNSGGHDIGTKVYIWNSIGALLIIVVSLLVNNIDLMSFIFVSLIVVGSIPLLLMYDETIQYHFVRGELTSLVKQLFKIFSKNQPDSAGGLNLPLAEKAHESEKRILTALNYPPVD